MSTRTPFGCMRSTDKVWLSKRRERIKHLIRGIYGEVRGKRILDVGMGRWSLIKNVFPELYVVGIDVVYPSLPPDELYLVDAKKDLPFKDSEFAMVFMGEIIEHLGLRSAYHLLKEVFRVLQTEGYLLLTTPNGFRNRLKKNLKATNRCWTC